MFKDQIEKGASLLDEKIPGWWDDIDLEILDINDACKCVIGQSYGRSTNRDYWEITAKWFLEKDPTQKCCDYGFYASSEEDIDLAKLTQEWKKFIQDRRDRVQSDIPSD